MTKRLDYLDISKGICILLVVIGHILQFNFKGTASNNAFNFIYSFHMPVFMLLSGYVAALSRKKISVHVINSFLWKKFSSLAIPFFVWGLIVNPFVIRQLPIGEFCSIGVSLLSNPSTGAWFIITLFCIQVYFLCFCLLTSLFGKPTLIKEIFSFLLVIGTLVGASAVATKYCDFVSGGVNIYISIRYLTFFFMGYFYEKYMQKMIFNKIALLSTLLMFVLTVRYFSFGVSPFYLQFILGFFASIVILNLSAVLEFSEYFSQTKMYLWIKNMGKNSLVIYLTHIPVVTIFQTGYKWNTDNLSAIPLCLLLAFIALVVAMICEAFGKLISENKTLNFLLFGRIKK